MNFLQFKSSSKSNFLEQCKIINWEVIFILFLFFLTGSAVLYSASGGNLNLLVKNHIIKFLFSSTVFIFLLLINYKFIKSLGLYFYLISVASLIFLIFFGTESAGSKRWISLGFFSIQPSEFAKIFLVLAIAKYYSEVAYIKNNSFIKSIFPILLILVPFLLIVNQPDLGTSLLLLANGLSIIIVSGINVWLIVIGVIIFISLIPLAWNLLHNYQQNRILTFLNPENDPLGSGYHIAQSKIAIGSGGFTGKGYMQGSQSQLEFIPEIHTDFVFSIFSEEFGFLGSIIIILLHFYLFFYGMKSSFYANNEFDKLVVFGLTINYFFYFLTNISMVIGLIPVVGVPLPVISYGGSSMLAIIISFAIIQKININRKLAN
tara:strand:+ start:228 stop:1352 length:1125 start_codon:yes stop_codon:yes gene_type:complete